MLPECSSWASRNGAVQMFFLIPICKVIKAFGCVVGVYFFIINVEWVDVCKMSEVT